MVIYNNLKLNYVSMERISAKKSRVAISVRFMLVDKNSHSKLFYVSFFRANILKTYGIHDYSKDNFGNENSYRLSKNDT